MKKFRSYCLVFLKYSRRKLERTVYTDGQKYFIKWYGEYVEVVNTDGVNEVTDRWVTVESY